MVTLRDCDFIILTREIYEATLKKIEEKPNIDIDRDKASPVDTISGAAGEFLWAEYYYGDYRKNTVGSNKGKNDFIDTEVKCSCLHIGSDLEICTL